MTTSTTNGIPESVLEAAHDRSFRNKETMEKSELAGCFYCCRVYPTSQVKRYVRENEHGHTAVCPHCSIDSVLGDSAGYPLTPEFLRTMHSYWFQKELTWDGEKYTDRKGRDTWDGHNWVCSKK
jgi:hypothetical protein